MWFAQERVGVACRALARSRAILALWLLVAVVPCSCQREPIHETGSPSGEEPLQLVEHLTLRESEGGRLRWVLVADSALSYGQGEPTLLRGVHVDFYGADGDTIRSTLTALEGEVEEQPRQLWARGAVRIETREGHGLETEELRWDHETGKVRSERFVRLTKGESVLTGIGIESDPELHSYRILSEVAAGIREGERILEGLQDDGN